jgi:Tfp pilus assembly protein PilE
VSTRSTKGFTLIEVLIAGVILFMVIAATTMVYRSALLSSNKAQDVLAISGYIPQIVDNITDQLQQQDTGTQNSLQGQGLSMQINYNWQGRLIQAKSAPPVIDSFTGELLAQPARYRLWQIELELKLGNTTRIYQYEDFTYPVMP